MVNIMYTENRIDKATYGLYCQLPSQLLIEAIVNYFKSTDSGKFGELFGGNIFPYRRDDTMEAILPSVNIYSLGYETVGDIGYLKGTLRLEFNLPASLNRDRQTEAGVVIAESLFLLTRNPEWINSIINIVPALKELGTKLTANYEKLYPNKQDSLMLVVTMNYKIDIAGYFTYLNEHGLDIINPCKSSETVKSYTLRLK